MNQKSIIFILITFFSVSSASPIVKTLTEGDAQVNIPSTQFDTREKNWEITQKWLIESINRLREEINELGHNYNVHMASKDADIDRNQANFVHDIAVLRADHTILANQQKEIITLIKNQPSVVMEKLISPVIVNKLPKNSANFPKFEQNSANLQETSGNFENSQETSGQDANGNWHKKDMDTQSGRRHHKRHHPRVEKLEEKEEKLEEKGEKLEEKEEKLEGNLNRMNQQVSALHDITLALFHGVQDLETKIEKNDNTGRR